MGFSRQEYWSGLPFPSPGDRPDPGIEPASPALQVDSLLMNHQGRATEVLGDQDSYCVTVSLGRWVSPAWGWVTTFCLTHMCVHPHRSAFSAFFLFYFDEAMVWKQPGISQTQCLRRCPADPESQMTQS